MTEAADKPTERSVESEKGSHVGGDQISVGDISGSQAVAFGRKASATVTGSSNEASAKIDARELKAALEELWEALDSSSLPRESKRKTFAAASNAIDGVAPDRVDGDGVIDNVKKVGEALKETNTAIEEGSSLWNAIKKLAPLLGPIVGGASIVAGWFGVPL